MAQHRCLACGNQFNGPDGAGQVSCPRCHNSATTPAAAGGYPQGPAGGYPSAGPPAPPPPAAYPQGGFAQAPYPTGGYPPAGGPGMGPPPSGFAPPPARGSSGGKVLGCLGVVVVVGVLIGVAVWWFGGGRYRAFDPHIASYTKAPVAPAGRAGLSGLPMPVSQPIPGKLVCVDIEKNKVHSLQSSLPDALRATKHEDVGTVAQIRKSKEEVGKYTTGQKAFSETWEISLVDLKTNQLLGKKSFTGQPPQTVKSNQGDQTGEPKSSDVVPWLEQAKRGGK